MSRLTCFVACLLQVFSVINSQGYYSIVAPGAIRPNSEYHVAVSVHKSNEPSTIKLGIISSSYSDFKTIELAPYASDLVAFDIPDLKHDDYNLTAEGISGIEFTNATKLNFIEKQISVFIQTDKAIYKPGDLVRFRALVLDPNTRPARINGGINIAIDDGKDNRIKQIKNVNLTRGVYSDELQLSNQPVLGDWTITVEVNGEKFEKKFEIAEYVLPKFEVIIETPKHAIYKDGKIRATIRSKYTFGKPIKGEATVSVYPKLHGPIQPFLYDLITRKVVPIDGKARVEFDIKDELKFSEEWEKDIMLEAIVEEKLTGRKQNTTTVVKLHKHKYNIKPVKVPKHYVPDVPFEVILKVEDHDGAPIQDSSNRVRIFASIDYGQTHVNESEQMLDQNGMAAVTFVLPNTDRHSYTIHAEYLDLKTSFASIAKRAVGSGNFIQLEVKTENPTVGNEVSVEVTSNTEMKYFVFQIAGRGDVVVSQLVQVPDRKYHIFKFLASFAMSPKAKLFVYYVKDGDLIFDETEIEFGEELWNFIKLDVPIQASPGQDVDITVTTKPNSYVGLLGVDQSVLLLKSGNDLSHSGVFEELKKYDSTVSEIHGVGKLPGRDSGLVTLTNADYPFDKNARPTTPSSTSTISDDFNDIYSNNNINNTGKETTIKKTDVGPAHKFEVNTRPPLAGPYAFSRIPKPFWNRPRVHIMHEIMDTWLFLNISSGNEGRTTIHKKVPDTITSWIVTGFSLDPVTGLGLSKIPRKMQVFQPFFVSTDLPYSVKRGEVIAVPIVVFNYMDRDLNAEVTLENTAQEFEFTEVTNEINETPRVELYRRKRFTVASNSGQATSFMIRPKKAGHITIKVTATTPIAGDAIEKMLLVQPEGVTEYINKPILVDLRDKSEQIDNITIEIPRNVVSDSTFIEVSVVGDLLGPSIKNLDKLIKKPYGCGEQNMINFVPNIFILKYLMETDQLTPAIESKAKKYLDIGYQRELTYKHPDGSYSAFGTSDSGGSTWLTAYVARSFRQASDYSEVDENIIKKALEFLANNQAANGSFPEVGKVIDNQHSSGSDKSVPLTAFTVLAFLENSKNIPEYRNVIDKALDYLVRNVDASDELYSIAIAAYALQKANHNAKDSLIQFLEGRATTDADKKWWSAPIPEAEMKSPWYSRPRSVDVELTSYALLAFLEAGHVTESLPIMKWLVSQRNKDGGFESTQDTVVGLQAMVKFAEKLSAKDSNVQVVFKYGDGAETRMNVNADNSIVLQSYELPSTARDITITSSGRGIAMVQVSYKYNVNVTGAWPRFSLDPQVNRISHSDYLHLSVCTSFVPLAGAANESNMAVMEVGLPSGFTVDPDTLPSLEATERIKKVETKDGDTVVVLYFDSLSPNEICPTLDAYKTHKVANQKPAPVIIYDYYDNARQARMFYSAPKSSLCDICEGEDCGTTCTERSEQRQQLGMSEDVMIASSSWILPSLSLTAAVAIFSRLL